MRIHSLAAAASVAVAIMGVPSAAQATVDGELLNTYKNVPASVTNAAGPETSELTLKSGKQYKIIVTGTWSRWGASYWQTLPTGWSTCGTPERFAQIPSLVAPFGKVSSDAETNFAKLDYQPNCASTSVNSTIGATTSFEINLGSGFYHPSAVGGPFTTPAPGHVYTYRVTGQGSKPQFRVVDQNTQDNYGQLAIAILPAL